MSKKILVLLCILFENAFASDNLKYVHIAEYPYHVSIENYGSHICSGALIHESWVITAASCVSLVESWNLSVRTSTSVVSSGGNKLGVYSILIHPHFNRFMLASDIALIKLSVPVQFGRKVQPIELPKQEDELKDGTMCFVTGWRQIERGPEESQLTAIEVPLVNHKICTSLMPCYEPMLRDMLCVGNMTPEVETCQGDQGAPLMSDQTLIGVLSYGLGCKTMEHPGIYTRVSSYLAWISENTGIHYTQGNIPETTMSTLLTFSGNTDLKPPSF